MIKFSIYLILYQIGLLRLLAFFLVLLVALNWGYTRAITPESLSSWQVQGILTALDDPEPRVQVQALNKIAEPGADKLEFLRALPSNKFEQIVKLLEFEEPQVRGNAARALGQMGEAAKKQAPRIAQLLNDPNVLAREGAIEALGQMGEVAKQQAPQLIELLQEYRDPYGNWLATKALVQMGQAAKDQIPTLVELLRAPRRGTRDRAAIVLGAIGTVAKERDPEIITLLRQPSVISNLTAVEVLIQLQEATEEDAFRLLEPLGGSSSDKQIAAAKALGKMGQTAAAVAPRLVELLQDPEPESDIRRGAAMALGQMGEAAKEQLPQIVALLQHPNPDFREAAARTLGGMGAAARDQLPKLLDLLQDPHPEVRRWTINALGEMGATAREATPALVKSLSDSYFYAWKWAIGSLGAIGRATGEYPPELVQMLDNPDPVLRSRAVLALGEMKQTAKDIVPRIAQLLEDPDSSVRRSTLQALESMGPSATDAASEVAKLLDDVQSASTELPENWSEYQSRESIRQVALEVLGEIGQGAKAQIPEMVKLLKDPEVSLTAALALAKMGSPAREYAPQIAAFLSKQEPDIFLYPDYVLNRGKSLALHLEKMGPLERKTALALLNAIYVPPSFKGLRGEDPKINFFPKIRFYAYYLCSTDPDAVILIQWLGLPQRYPSNLNREQGLKILKAFADAWGSSEPFPELRQDLAVQIAKVVSQVEWQIDDLSLLRTHYHNLQQNKFKPQAETVRQVLEQFSAWRRAWRGLYNLLSFSNPLPVSGLV